MSTKTKWSNVLLLFTSQALFQTGTILVMTLSGMVGLKLAPEESLSTLPIAMISVGTATMMIPASFVIRKIGQRKGFMIGTILGVLSGLLSFYAIINSSFILFIVGNMLVGTHQGFAQYYRFAAADAVPEHNKGKAISFVIAGGVAAAFAGPNLAKFTQHLGTMPYAYSFISITFLSIVALCVLFFLKLPKNTIAENQNGETLVQERPLTEIIKQRTTLAAFASSAVGYSVMMMIMTATPLAMHHFGFSPDQSATVIQWHVLGMFVPSFFTGILIGKFGVHKIILSGIIIFFLYLIFALTGTGYANFILALILLGIGWNFMYIGGSTLLTKVYQPIEKEKVQAFHDFFVFGAISLSGLSAGGLLKYWGWQGINLAVVPLLITALVSIILYVINIKSAKQI
ncbi:MFS transporter [Olivibacter sp. SDN3]|uniref:MFS transporter n=1 Tax=Olivibacter sp. SDN3 TaxID=2764720 RepID=UPI001651219B|nr:MFS transporter [Olivibacter sp. SDN3]QNL52214.1 MFS transporter [Olivibacter sp. SDN3]